MNVEGIKILVKNSGGYRPLSPPKSASDGLNCLCKAKSTYCRRVDEGTDCVHLLKSYLDLHRLTGFGNQLQTVVETMILERLQDIDHEEIVMVVLSHEQQHCS